MEGQREKRVYVFMSPTFSRLIRDESEGANGVDKLDSRG